MSESPLLPYIEPMILYLQNAFTNQLSRQGEYRDGDLLPGERVATLVLQTLRENRDRSARGNLAGASSWVFEFQAAIAVAVETEGLDSLTAQFQADIEAAKEMLNLSHAVACMKDDMPNAFNMIEDIRVRMPIDSAPSVLLDDRSVWIISIPAIVELWIWVRRDQDGKHILLQG